jgi:hypothetical protein
VEDYNAITDASVPLLNLANVEHSGVRLSKRRRIENSHLKDYVL